MLQLKETKSTELWAAIEGDVEKVIRLIKAGADVNSVVDKNKGWTPLHRAASLDKSEATKVLIYSGADINVRSE